MLKKFSLALNSFFLFFFIWYFFIHVGIGSYYQRVKGREMFFDNIYYRAKVDSYDKLNSTYGTERKFIVFLGDSIIEQFPINELFSGRKDILNRGIGFDTTLGVLKRLAYNVNNLKVSSLFVMIGHNDIKYRTVDETVRNIGVIMKDALAERKFFLSIPPSYSNEDNLKIIKINDYLKRDSIKMGFQYIDIYHLFLLPNGKFNIDLFYDGVHPNVTGYNVMKKYILKVCSEKEMNCSL